MVQSIPRFVRPEAASSVFFLCDVQEKFRELIHKFPSLVYSSNTLLSVADVLDRPVVCTEQYTKVFQYTVHELQHHLKNEKRLASNKVKVFDKLKFSMLTDEVNQHLEENVGDFQHAILFGIEAHVCVQQTALDLLEKGKCVHVVVDACSSQRPGDRTVALHQLSAAGAVLTTTESIALSLVGTAEHPDFKKVSRTLIDHKKGLENLPTSLDHF